MIESGRDKMIDRIGREEITMQLFEEHMRQINEILDRKHAETFRFHVSNMECFECAVEEEEEVQRVNFSEQADNGDLQEGMQMIDDLIRSAQDEKEKSRKECEKYGKERTELIIKKEEAAGEYEKIKNADNQLTAEINGLLEYNRQLDQEKEWLSSQLEDLSARIHKANQKEKYARKWCWVPGYGLYVSIDYATDDDVKRLESLSSQREMFNRAYEDNLHILEEKRAALERDDLEHSQKSKKLLELQIKLNQVNDEITKASLNVSQWDKIQDQYRKLKTMLSLQELSGEAAMNRLKLMEMDTGLFKRELVRAFSEESVAEKNGRLTDGLITPGGVAYAFHQGRVEMIREDMIPGVKSIRLEKQHVLFYDYVVKVTCRCPKNAKILSFVFRDESGDKYTLNILRKDDYEHTVRYSSDLPNLVSIEWRLRDSIFS